MKVIKHKPVHKKKKDKKERITVIPCVQRVSPQAELYLSSRTKEDGLQDGQRKSQIKAALGSPQQEVHNLPLIIKRYGFATIFS